MEKTFTITSQATYSETSLPLLRKEGKQDDMVINVSDDDLGSAEFIAELYNWQGKDAVRLTIFTDAMANYNLFKDVLDAWWIVCDERRGRGIGFSELVAVLQGLGFVPSEYTRAEFRKPWDALGTVKEGEVIS